MYKYNGNTYTLEELRAVLGVEVITEALLIEKGITMAEETEQAETKEQAGQEDFQTGVAETDADVTPTPTASDLESRLTEISTELNTPMPIQKGRALKNEQYRLQKIYATYTIDLI